MATVYASERATIANSLKAIHLAPVNMPDERTSHIDFSSEDLLGSISFEKLISLRRAHQTKQAATGTRTSRTPTAIVAQDNTSISSESKKQQETERQRLVKRFAEVIKQQEERGAGTGTDRRMRWQGAAAGGNTANAAQAAAARDKAVRLNTLTAIHFIDQPY